MPSDIEIAQKAKMQRVTQVNYAMAWHTHFSRRIRLAALFAHAAMGPSASIRRSVIRRRPRCQVIIRDRFGLGGQERPAKFRELAAKLRLSSERVRQLLERALSQLREMTVSGTPSRDG